MSADDAAAHAMAIAALAEPPAAAAPPAAAQEPAAEVLDEFLEALHQTAVDGIVVWAITAADALDLIPKLLAYVADIENMVEEPWEDHEYYLEISGRVAGALWPEEPEGAIFARLGAVQCDFWTQHPEDTTFYIKPAKLPQFVDFWKAAHERVHGLGQNAPAYMPHPAYGQQTWASQKRMLADMIHEFALQLEAATEVIITDVHPAAAPGDDATTVSEDATLVASAAEDTMAELMERLAEAEEAQRQSDRTIQRLERRLEKVERFADIMKELRNISAPFAVDILQEFVMDKHAEMHNPRWDAPYESGPCRCGRSSSSLGAHSSSSGGGAAGAGAPLPKRKRTDMAACTDCGHADHARRADCACLCHDM